MLAVLTRADTALAVAVRTRGHNPTTERAARAFSKTGEHALLWLALGATGALVDRPRRAAWTQATARVALAFAANSAIKLTVRRRRPELDGLPALISTPTQLSFPSAHASSSFAAARGFAPLLGGKRYIYPVATAMAATRVYLGVHYPSDIVAGALLGTLIAGATTS
ncbi:MAG TPA: phosphatase PAP2 family protein [Baekduia sp.]